jgi:molecular chaperone DnaK
MVRDAEAHSSEDKKKRELIEAKNHADSTVYQTEKSLREFGDKIDAADKQKIEEKLAELKKVMEGSDPEAMKKAGEELMQASHKLAEAVYAQSQQKGGEAGSENCGSGCTDENCAKPDNVVDADFEEVKDEKK